MKTLDRIKKDPRVKIVDVEDDGIIVTLFRGWSFDPLQDNRVIGGDTPTEVLSSLQNARPFAGPFTD